MTNLTITSTTNSITIDFNDLFVYRESITSYKQNYVFTKDAEDIHISIIGQQEVQVSTTDVDNSFVVDSVNGVAPTDLSDLYTKLKALIA